MKNVFTFLISLFAITNMLAQGLTNFWPMGYANGNPTPFGGMYLDFISGQPVYSIQDRKLNFDATIGVISDDSGNFLFASNGIFVQNAADDTTSLHSNRAFYRKLPFFSDHLFRF